MAETASASPSGPQYAPEDPSLPKPWKGLVDGKTGYLYFWNPDTNVTQYERPVASSGRRGASPICAKSGSVPISSSVHAHHSAHRGGRVEEDVRHNGDVHGRPKLAPIPTGRSQQV
ncbi:hypothetical protein IFM89_033851 [Coptis chinensis]|uniref:WW domain-containing protein n=1 Tax=Coptis chinensis TaxID=261450 RepID=A0A835HX23_9MAGN|nr:hypothetical protein IFM89_033851 [Coptis chinensis]